MSQSADLDDVVNVDRLGPALVGATGDDRWAGFDAILIAGGKSNLTFELRSAAGELVLRRPPRGPLLPSAHDMGREVRVQRALVNTGIPVATIVLADDTSEILGTPFYVMQKVEGVVMRDHIPPGYADGSAEREKIADALVDTLAAIHAVVPHAVGLADYGRPDGFLARQLRRWTAQSAATREDPVPALVALAAMLEKKLPDSPSPTLVHGDFRLDNCMFDPGDPGKVAAVLDWELSTLGDPLTDIGLLSLYWPEPGEAVPAIVPMATALGGFPRRAHLLERYAAKTGNDLAGIGFYEAFARFKFAVIIQGVAARAASGAMAGQDFGNVDEDVIRLAEAGLTALENVR